MEHKENWEDYRNRLESYGYTPEQIEEVGKIRNYMDLCEFDQFQELVSQGIVIRTNKLKKKRHLYVNESGQFLYLNHYFKKYRYIGYFKSEE